MTLKLQGKTAIVTGGANGIGRAVCERLAADGATIAIADIADAAATVALVKAAGGRAISIKCDLTSAEAVAAMRASVETEFGAADILIHNAGIYPATLFEDMAFEEWRRVLNVNLDSIFHLAKAVIPGMKAKGWAGRRHRRL